MQFIRWNRPPKTDDQIEERRQTLIATTYTLGMKLFGVDAAESRLNELAAPYYHVATWRDLPLDKMSIFYDNLTRNAPNYLRGQ